jgi:hypothetical protein
MDEQTTHTHAGHGTAGQRPNGPEREPDESANLVDELRRDVHKWQQRAETAEAALSMMQAIANTWRESGPAAPNAEPTAGTVPDHRLYDYATGDDLGPATTEQIEASLAAGDDGAILIDADGDFVKPGSWGAQQPGTRPVFGI